MTDERDITIAALRSQNAILETKLAQAEKRIEKLLKEPSSQQVNALTAERDQARQNARDQKTRAGEAEHEAHNLRQKLESIGKARRTEERAATARLVERLKLVYRVGTLGDELAAEVTKRLPPDWRDLDTSDLVVKYPEACADVQRIFLAWCRRRYLAHLGWDDQGKAEIPTDLLQLAERIGAEADTR